MNRRKSTINLGIALLTVAFLTRVVAQGGMVITNTGNQNLPSENANTTPNSNNQCGVTNW